MSMSTCTDSRSIACIPHRNFVPSGKVLISWYPPSRGKPHQSVLYMNTPPLLAPYIFSIEILHISLYFLEIEVGILLWISTFFFCCFSKISIFSFLTYSYQHNYEFCLCKFSLRISLPKTFCIFLARPHLLFFSLLLPPLPLQKPFLPLFSFPFFSSSETENLPCSVSRLPHRSKSPTDGNWFPLTLEERQLRSPSEKRPNQSSNFWELKEGGSLSSLKVGRNTGNPPQQRWPWRCQWKLCPCNPPTKRLQLGLEFRYLLKEVQSGNHQHITTTFSIQRTELFPDSL